MLTSRWHGERLGACTDCRRFWAKYRAGEVTPSEINEIEGNLATTAGTCAVMGTASTMASIAEALGMILPGSAAIPAVHADRLRAAEATGRAAMQLAASRLTPDKIVTQQSVENALRVLMAIGGSTNAVLHLTAIAGRAGVEIDLRHLNRDQRHDAGHRRSEADRAALHGGSVRRRRHRRGAPRVAASPASRLHDRRRRDPRRAPRRTGRTGRIARWCGRSPSRCSRRAASSRCSARCPEGRDLQALGRRPKLFEKEGRAIVFTSLEDLSARIDDPELDVTPDDFMVLQHAGPLSPSGMPEAGYLPIPAKLARAGVKDMVRISDARMSGTAYGSIVLHVTPDAASGGPLAKVRNGDRIRLSVKERRIDLLVAPEELARRKTAPAAIPERGYARLYRREILQADRGCDFDFLRKHPIGDGRA